MSSVLIGTVDVEQQQNLTATLQVITRVFALLLLDISWESLMARGNNVWKALCAI